MAGQGGQGLILAGLVLAEALALHDGKNVVMSQSYGAEQRGGLSRSEVIVSDGEIDFPKVIEADLLLVLTQEAYDRFSGKVKKEGLVVVDPSLVLRADQPHTLAFPLTESLKKGGLSTVTLSIAALGLISRLTGLVTPEALHRALVDRAPAGTAETNWKAVEVGMGMATEDSLAVFK